MPPTHQKLNDSRVANFRSFKNFDKIIDEKTVRCKCRNTVRLDHPFRTTNFERHIKSHNCILGTDNQQSLYNFFDQKQEIQAEETELREPLPCIGLFGDLYTAYATSTPAFFGGGERPEVVGKRLFPEKFPQDTPFCRKKLNKDQIQEFNTALQATATWKVDQFEGVIQSAKCEIMTTKLSGLCNECLNLQNNKELKHAIKVKRATQSTVKYIPKFYFNINLINLLKNGNLKDLWNCIIVNKDDTAMWASLAQMGMNGAFSGEKTFTELASLMLQIKKKEDSGVSLKELITDSNLVLENITKFACIAKELKWKGPVLLMTDCTKIRPKLVYSQELGYITGSTLSPSEVSISNINDIYTKVRYIYEKNAIATQVRVITLKIPIGKIPPMVIAILPTKGDETAEKIFNILHLVLDFAQQSNINILSIGANGVRSEFNAQTQIINSAPTHIVFSDPFYNVHFKALIINGKPIVRVQDPKHAKKTARNQLFTGARLLSLGIGTARYDQLFQLAHQDQHVLLKRDVLNVDKQDDSAAYRMFHSENLAQIIRLGTIPSDMIGLFIYLFVLGELCDAYLNREIDHKARIHMDFYLDYPLFLWEYGTEALEHIFGISRQVIADFNFYEFYKIQKRIMYRDKIVRAELINTSRDRTSAGGYVFDIDGTSLSHKIIERLRTWPSEDDFKEAIRVGYSEAIELASYLQIDN
ncbi:hypothetical protein RhiirA1_401104 [Rhizophagus irregularis]|uniref:Uncharacterized protein n=1 Tax=Rhizophagus irregularis TaxID=588596 RepID=A0A2N0R3D0_9GLOM|nr:hypothetical protein RhiirA1_401104 [Rhizophagus irregularis]